MSNYQIFAKFYDRLTQNIRYQVRSDYISDFFIENGMTDGTVLDLACGTGNLTKCLCEKGYAVTGLDLSEEMLAVASSKCNATFLKGDMRRFQLPQRFDACVCSLDALNHLERLADWSDCFSCVHQALKENGIFIFDINTIYKHNEILGNHAFIFEEEDFFLAWDNELLEDNKVRILLDFFIPDGEVYQRYSEEFIECAYPLDTVKAVLSDYFDILGVHDDLSKKPPHKKSERVYFICKRK